jgi:hypothetical protein
MVTARSHAFREGWEAAECTDTPFHWKAAHRFVAIRRPRALESEERPRALFPLKHHTSHRAVVTHLSLTPDAVSRCYCDRAAQELLLRAFKDADHVAHIPPRSVWANAAYLECILWAYDLVVAFQHLCLPEDMRHWNIATLRRELWWLPAEWVNHSGQQVIRLPRQYPPQARFRKIQAATAKVTPLL